MHGGTVAFFIKPLIMTSSILDRTVGGQVAGLVQFNLTLLVIDGDHHVLKIQQTFTLQLL